MLKRQSKVLSIALIFVFCMSFMFAGFIAPNAAEAATYSTSTVPSVSKIAGQDLGPVIIDFPILNAGYHKGVIKLPKDFELDNNTTAGNANARISDLSDNAGTASAIAKVIATTPGAGATPKCDAFAITTNIAVTSTVTITADPGGVASAEVFTATAAVAAPFDFVPGSTIADTTKALVAAINADSVNFTAYVAPTGAIVLVQRTAAAANDATVVVAGAGGAVSPVVEQQPFAAVTDGQMRLTKLAGNQLQFEIFANGIKEKIKLGVNLDTVKVPSSAEAEIKATIIKLDGDFSDGILTVAKTTGGAVDVLRTDPGVLTSGNTVIPIHIREDVAEGLVVNTGSLKLKLPNGVKWTGTPTVHFFPGPATAPTVPQVTATIQTDESVILITRTAGLAGKQTFTMFGTISIDEEVATFGDIMMTVSGKSTVNTSSVKLGNYQDFGYTITAKKPETELIAGRVNQEISDINIKENVNGSLFAGRQVYMELPDGVEWSDTTARTFAPVAAGTCTFTGATVSDGFNITFNRSTTNYKKVNGPIAITGGTKGEMDLKNLEVDVAPDFVGPIEITFSGSAGISEKVKVAEVVAPVTGTAETNEVIIGKQTQKAGNIVIKEKMADAILATMAARYPAGKTYLTLTAPQGVTWAKLPTVKVLEGDINLGEVTRNWDNSSRWHSLNIEIRNASRTASTIEVSDVYYTLDRTVAEGDLEIDVTGSALDQSWQDQFINRNAVASIVAAKCVTPAPGETIESGQFKISSNIYYVGGVAKVMDVAPYIKGDRTYVPMRYLGEMLGAEVVWDDAARTVTLTKGDDVVVFTIGSATYTVNGESKVADVAPEISQDRTMLPARFVAEAFGAQVGWDAGTRTVLIQK